MRVEKTSLVVLRLVLLLVAPTLSVTAAEEGDQEIIRSSTTGSDSTPETFIIAVLTGFCAICLSFVVVIMTCYDLLEDRTIRRYKRDGVPAQAKVLEGEFKLAFHAQPMLSQS